MLIALSRLLLLVGKVMEKLSLILLKEYVSIYKLTVFLKSNAVVTSSFAVCFSGLLIEVSYYLWAAFFLLGSPRLATMAE